MREILLIEWFDFARIWQLTTLPLGPLEEKNEDNVLYCHGILHSFANDERYKEELPDLAKCCENFADVVGRLLTNKEPYVTEEDLTQYTRWFRDIRTFLLSETGKLSVILLEEINGYSVNTLWKHQWKLLADDVYPHLSDFVKDNFEEAAKCLVLNCYTAVGFHAMRSVELMARKYYELIIGKQPIIIYNQGKPNEKQQDMGLGGIANDLISKYTSLEQHKPKKIPSGNLGIIATTIQALTKTYRDPLSHPDINKLDKDQAITTLSYTKEMISAIVRDAKVGGGHFKLSWIGAPF